MLEGNSYNSVHHCLVLGDGFVRIWRLLAFNQAPLARAACKRVLRSVLKPKSRRFTGQTLSI